MIRLFILLSLVLSLQTSYAQELQVPYYDGVFVTDILQKGLRKEKLFSKMQERLIKMDSSICANRAHMWSYDFARFFEVDSAKIFIFYTPKTSRSSGERWWYHVAPVINEGGQFFAMDKAFMDQPVKIEKWLSSLASTTRKCYEIKNEDTDLINLTFITMPFPNETSRGKYECYYKIVPSTIWFPIGIALDVLGTDQKGNPITFKRNETIPMNEALDACVEASERDSKKPKDLTKAKERCEKYLQAQEPGAVKLPL